MRKPFVIFLFRLRRVAVSMVHGRRFMIVNIVRWHVIRMMMRNTATLVHCFGGLLAFPTFGFRLLQESLPVGFFAAMATIFDLIISNENLGGFAKNSLILAELTNPHVFESGRIMIKVICGNLSSMARSDP
jgi:hypothetical protein